MILSNLHTHTIHCDGQNTVIEMAEAAIEKRFRSLGFSAHSHAPFDDVYCLKPNGFQDYMRDVISAKEKYSDRLDIFLGMENDMCAPYYASALDYSLASIHYIEFGGEYLGVDNSESVLKNAIDKHFGGNGLKMALEYFKQAQRHLSAKRADIAAHFDIVTKFNKGGNLFFDEESKAYKEAAIAALSSVIESGYIIEVNTAGFRVPKAMQYPSDFLLEYALHKNAKIAVNSDAHMASAIDYKFEEIEQKLIDIGFKEIMEFTPNGFVAVPLKP